MATLVSVHRYRRHLPPETTRTEHPDGLTCLTIERFARTPHRPHRGLRVSHPGPWRRSCPTGPTTLPVRRPAAHGDADLVLVHDPEAEAKFVAEGHGLTRTEIAWNDFIIIGPRSDPAHVMGMHDAVAALRAIYSAKAPFISRGDKSGTDALEKWLWKAAELDPAVGGVEWYRDIGGGMGAALNAAAAMDAYTLSDRGIWLGFGNKDNMQIAVEGDPRLLNRYDVILLNPQAHPQAKQEPARVLATWLASPQGQAAIADYTISGQLLFHPESDQKP